MGYKERILAKYQIVALQDPIFDKIYKYVHSPKFFEEWFSRGGDGDTIWEEQVVQKDDNDVEDKEATLETAEEWFEEQWNDFEEKYSRAHGGGSKIMLWRCISVKDVDNFIDLLTKGKYLKGYTGVGIYWAYDKDIAECHWGKGGETITVEAEVPASSVDIKRTAYAIMHLGTGRDEAEITLKEGAPIKITQIYNEGDNAELLDKPIKAKA